MVIRINPYCVFLLLFIVNTSFTQNFLINSKQFYVNSLIKEENFLAKPVIASDMYSNYVIVWCDQRNGNYDIYAQLFKNNDSTVGSHFKVNDDTGDGQQYYPSVAMNKNGDFVIVWEDYRDSIGHIYSKKFSQNGVPMGRDFQVDDDNSRIGYQLFSCSVAINNTGNFVVAWQDLRELTEPDIYAQRFSSNGSVIGTNFKVTAKDTVFHWNSVPDIAMDNMGNFIITWAREYENIMARRFQKDGTPTGDNFKVSNSKNGSSCFAADIAMTDTGKFVIVWEDQHNVSGQLFNRDGLKVGDNFQVSNYRIDYEDLHIFEPSVSMRNNGNFIITWSDDRMSVEYGFDIYAQRFSDDGTPQDTNIVVNTNRLQNQLYSSITTSDIQEDFIITWEDHKNSNNLEIAIQRFLKDGTSIGNNFMINDISVGLRNKQNTFISPKFELYNNYPNPFNLMTRISYSIHEESIVSLIIYNTMGQEIRRLVDNSELRPGNYNTVWDGNDKKGSSVTSGVYYYRLLTKSYVKTMKMLLLK